MNKNNQPIKLSADFFRAMSLMEVLAAMFVISIGLLGVLAVIPYGVFQVAKARDAEYTSWMLANAVNDLQVMGLAKPEKWKITPTNTTSDLWTNAYKNNADGKIVYHYTNPPTPPTPPDHWLDCSRYFMIDPFDTEGTPDPSSHIYKVGVWFDNPAFFFFRNNMMGQDDLEYTIHSDKRADFSGQNYKIRSSGKYTWFFMFRPKFIGIHVDGSVANIPWDDVESSVNVDIIGCYNRTNEIRKVYANYKGISDTSDDYEPMLNGAKITFRSQSSEDLNFKDAQYIFVSWPIFNGNTILDYIEGTWCKVINTTPIQQENNNDIVDDDLAATTIPNILYSCTIFVTGGDFRMLPSNPDRGGSITHFALQGLIIPGVKYHTQKTCEIK